MTTHIVMTSGGLGSFITLDTICKKMGPENCIALFADTKIEDPDLYRFLVESVAYTQARLVQISDGRHPWEVFRATKFVGNTRVDPCSLHLKRILCDNWIKDNYLPTECIVYIGIDASESHRYDRLAPRKLPYIYKAPLVESGSIMSNLEKMVYCMERGIEPPDLYKNGFQHNNCGGFCVKAGLAQFKLLFDKLPERYEWHVQQERRTRQEVPNAKPFLRKTVSGKLHYLWLEDYRTFLQSGQPLTVDESYDFGGCGCALDGEI